MLFISGGGQKAFYEALFRGSRRNSSGSHLMAFFILETAKVDLNFIRKRNLTLTLEVLGGHIGTILNQKLNGEISEIKENFISIQKVICMVFKTYLIELGIMICNLGALSKSATSGTCFFRYVK